MFVRIGMRIAEEAVAGIDAIWTYRCRRGLALATWPRKRSIAREKANGRPANRTEPVADQLAG
jgi:hypothetical protein